MKTNTSGAKFLIPFGMLFLAVGAVIGFFCMRTLFRAEAMLAWQELPATVVACDLNLSRSSKGGTSYRVSARYQYEVKGVRYTGDRVSLHTGSDNIGSFHQRIYAELKRRMDRKEPAACWANPQNPGDAILIRKPRLELLVFMQVFAMVFGGVGLAVMLAGLAGILQRSDGQGQIRMNGAASHRVAAVFALAWNGYLGWFLWKAYHVTAPEMLPWYLWALAATGTIPAMIAGYLVGRVRKFGISVFEMSPMPGVLGGPVAGTIRIPAKVETPDGFEVVLRCIHQYTTGSGKQSSTRRDVEWEDSRHIDGNLSYGEESMLPVRFAVPYGQSATTAAGGCSGYYWRLTATAKAPGIDYKAEFDVPVQRTPQSSPTFVPQQMPDSTAGQEHVSDVISRASLKLEARSDGGFELSFPAARGLTTSLPLVLFVAGWSLPCYFLWTGAKAPLAIAVVFTLVDLILVAALLNALFVSRGVVVDRARRECVVWWRAACFSKRERHIPFGEVMDIRSERSGQSGNTTYYRVVMMAEGGRPVTVGTGMKMWTEAEDIAKLLSAAMKPDFRLEGFRV